MDTIEKLAHAIVDILRRSWVFLHKEVPEWLVKLATTLGEILFSLLSLAGQTYINQLTEKILSTSKEYPDSTGEEKFNIVWDFAHTILPGWRESDLDLLIQNLFSKLKKDTSV